jgi:hypothetical protein
MIRKTLFPSGGILPLLALLCLVACNLATAGGHRANGTFAGNQVHIEAGSGNTPSIGDFIGSNSAPGLGLPHNVFVEVPPGTSQLQVEIFDADIPNSGGSENATGLDGNVVGSFSSVTYRLINPAGGTVATFTAAPGATSLNNAWTAVFNPTTPIASPAAGHWAVQIDNTQGQTSNAYGVRAFVTTPGTGDRELNVYYQVGNHGKSDNNSTPIGRNWVDYPYIISGCSCATNDFDLDNTNATNGGNYQLTSPSGGTVFTIPATQVSANNVWAVNTRTGWTSDVLAADYGIWQNNIQIQSGGATNNYSNFYIIRDTAITPVDTAPPTSNLPNGSFRIYLPSDANAAPLKPSVQQSLDVVAGTGPNPPLVGQTTRVRVTIRVTNPTPFPITFSTSPSRLVTASVPAGTDTTFQGIDQISQGSIVSQPLVGSSSGTVTWNPGVVAAGAIAFLNYFVDVTPASTGRLVVTGTPASGGTTAVYLDETANASQARALITFGPLCELAADVSGTPLFVELESFDAVSNGVGQPVSLSWTTAMEVDNVGFHIYRAADNAGRSQQLGERLTSTIIPAQGNGTGASYQFVDTLALTSNDEARAYLLEDIDLDGTRTLHGPFRMTDPSGQVSNVETWQSY